MTINNMTGRVKLSICSTPTVTFTLMAAETTGVRAYLHRNNH